MYKDCINRQKQLEREESNGENAEEKLNVERSQIRIIQQGKGNGSRSRYMYVQFIIFGPTYTVYVD